MPSSVTDCAHVYALPHRSVLALRGAAEMILRGSVPDEILEDVNRSLSLRSDFLADPARVVAILADYGDGK